MHGNRQTLPGPSTDTRIDMPSVLKRPLVFILLVLAMLPTACAAPLPLSTDAPLSEAQARAELEHLYATLQASHYDLFARRPRAEYDTLYHQTWEGLDGPRHPDALRREFQGFVAYGNVAHARIDPPMAEWEAHRASGGPAFPLYLRVIDGRVFVQDDYSGVPGIALGDEVLSVNGAPALQWMNRIRILVSADNDYLAYTQMETQLPMLVWWYGDRALQYDIAIAKPAGQRRRLVLPARSRAEFEAVAVVRPSGFELDWNARTSRITDSGIGYLRPGPFYDNRPDASDPWDPTAFRTFIDEAFANFIDAGTKAVLIDLRNNPGGDNSFSDPMIAWFADKPFHFSSQFDILVSEAAIRSNAERLVAAGNDADTTSARLAAAYAEKPLGSRVHFPIPLVHPRNGTRYTKPVYLLINRHSYSNTVLVAAIAQDYGFATVLGEETADLASTYGAAEKFKLPTTGLEVSFPKARILRPDGDGRARGVIPDVAIQTPLLAMGADEVLVAALRILSEREPTGP
jgi:hypothetical protein